MGKKKGTGKGKAEKDKRGVFSQSRASKATASLLEEEETSSSAHYPQQSCSHLKKAINAVNLRKKLEKTLKDGKVFPGCQECFHMKPLTEGEGEGEKEVKAAHPGPIQEEKSHLHPASQSLKDSGEPPLIWICLQCGNQGCGRDSEHKHALNHSTRTGLNGEHHCALCLPSLSVHCYKCDEIVSPEQISSTTSIQHVISFLLRLYEKHGPSSQPESLPSAPQPHTPTPNQDAEVKGKAGKKGKLLESGGLEKVLVKGLSNLGNTCFFNSTLQCLMQCQQLRGIMANVQPLGGEKILLSPPPLGRPSPPSPTSSEGEEALNEDETSTPTPMDEDLNCTVLENLKPVTAELGCPGAVTKALLNIYQEFHNASTSSVLSPRPLFSAITAKAARFRGYAQQDAHELLRYLVDALKSEESGRVQMGICESLSLPNPPLPHTPNWAKPSEKLSTSQAATLKAYHSVAPYPPVEAVFGGAWLQTIRCTQCGHISQVLEPLLDVTLPINTQPLVKTKKVTAKEEDDDLEAMLSSKPKLGLSKAQLKKAKKEARRAAHGKKANKRTSTPSKTEDKDESSIHLQSSKELETEAALGSDGEGRAGMDPDEDQDGDGDGDGDVPSSPSPDTSTPQQPEEDDLDEDYGSGEEEEEKGAEEESEEQRLFRARAERLAPLSEMVSPGTLQAAFAAFTSVDVLCGKNKFGCENCTRLGNFPPAEEDEQKSSGLFSKMKRRMGESSNSRDEGDKDKQKSSQDSTKPTAPKVAYVVAEKNYLLFAPPAVLTVHLKRFQAMFRGFSKLNTGVTFPLLLDVAPYTSAAGEGVPPKNSTILYALFGVVVHSGSMNGGHYIAFVKRRPLGSQLQTAFLRRNPAATGTGDSEEEEAKEPGRVEHSVGIWYEVSDSSVKEVSEDRVLRAQAYLLFYERIR